MDDVAVELEVDELVEDALLVTDTDELTVELLEGDRVEVLNTDPEADCDTDKEEEEDDEAEFVGSRVTSDVFVEYGESGMGGVVAVALAVELEFDELVEDALLVTDTDELTVELLDGVPLGEFERD